MIRSLLLGAIAGSRAITPLAAVSDAASKRLLPPDNGAPALIRNPLVAAGSKALAAGEIAGDKMESAPDRIGATAMAARVLSGAIVGSSVAPRDKRVVAALFGAAGAIGTAYLSFHLRVKAIRRYGQKPTGMIEDALVLGATRGVMKGATLPSPKTATPR